MIFLGPAGEYMVNTCWFFMGDNLILQFLVMSSAILVEHVRLVETMTGSQALYVFGGVIR